MMAGDEFYDDEVTSPDLRAMADFRRDELKHSSACAGCGSLEPARIVGRTCSDCAEFPRCAIHHGWLPCRSCEVVIEDHGAYVVVAEVAP